MHDKIDFTPRLLRRDKKVHFILSKEAGLGENMILNRCALNTGAPNLIKQIQLAVKPQSKPSKIIEVSLILWRFLSIDRSSLLKNRNRNIK